MSLIFESLKRGPVKTRVADAVRNAIYAAKLRPGDPLLELQLAKDFEVSQTSVREALIHLEQLGLVRRVANKGTFVTELSPEQVRDRLEVRLKLEYMAAIRAAPRVTAIEVSRLHELADQIAAATSRKEYFEAAQYDLEFHRTLWRLSNSETLYQVLDQIAAPLFAFVSIVRSSSRAVPIVLHSHHDIVNALEGGDHGVIQSSLENHFADSYDHFVAPQSASADNAD